MITDTELRTTVRVLPPEEWEKLRALPIGQDGLPNPALAMIIVAETSDGQIVGTWAATTQVFLDGLWTAPEYRRTTWVAAKILKTMKAVLREHGVARCFTMVHALDVLCLAAKGGFEQVHGTLLTLWVPPDEHEGT